MQDMDFFFFVFQSILISKLIISQIIFLKNDFITCGLCIPEGKKGQVLMSSNGWFDIPQLY